MIKRYGRESMVIVKIGDGLGNQIYNYVCGYAAAKHNNEALKLDTSECDNSTLRDYMLGYFNLDEHARESFPNKTFWQKVYKRVRRNIKYHVIMEKDFFMFDRRVFRKKNLRNKYLHGYWQNIRYFEMYQSDIIRQLKPIYNQSQNVINTGKLLKEENTCAVHMRGGDIDMLPMDYFQRAISYMNEIKNNPTYIIFSNQMDKAKKYLKNMGVLYKTIDDYGRFSDIDEFFLMSSCQGQIISNSSYSRWAALISENKGVIAPNLKKYNEILYPDHWIVL